MSLALSVSDGGDIDRTAAALVREAARFQRRVSSANRTAVEHNYRPVLIGMVPQFMPSGYRPTLVADLRVRTQVRFAGNNPGVTVIVSAPTKTKGRSVNALEAGVLRHPKIGSLHPVRKPRAEWDWDPQKIRRGFASIPLKATRPLIVNEIDDELARIARDVKRS